MKLTTAIFPDVTRWVSTARPVESFNTNPATRLTAGSS